MSNRTLPPLAQAFDRAIRIVEKGWCQYSMYKNRGIPVGDLSEYGSACLIGAINKAATDSVEFNIMFRRTCSELPYYTSLAKWNDMPQRSKQDVIALLQRAKAKVIEEVQL